MKCIIRDFLITIFQIVAVLIYSSLFVSANNQTNSMPDDLTDLLIEDLMKIEIETVYSASRFMQKTIDAPSLTSIVTSADIKQYGYRTLSEILNSLMGFYTTYDRNYNYIGVRGFNRPGDYNSRVLLLIDGQRINDNIYNTASIGTDFILDIDLIERIEVVRGPGSSLYGTNAFFGVINVITKNGSSLKGMEISGEAGSYDTYKGRISYGNRFENGLDVVVSGTSYKSNGQSLYFNEYDKPSQNNGRSDGCDYDKNKSFFAKLSMNGFTLEGAYNSRNKGIPTGVWGALFNDSSNQTTNDNSFVNLECKHSFDNMVNMITKVDKLVKSHKYGHSRENWSPELIENTGFPLSWE